MQKDNHDFIVAGRFIKIASYKDEWFEDIEDLETFIGKLKTNKVKADIFTFWQRLPDSMPKYKYHMEWDNVAALKISTFENWWNKQIDAKTRNVTRKAEKKGVIIKYPLLMMFFAQGITDIFNETPVRQDKPSGTTGRISRRLRKKCRQARTVDIHSAYFNDNLIGFIKMLDAGKYLDIVEILSMIEHRDKAPTNALLAKAVEICAQKNIPYLVYAHWPRGLWLTSSGNNAFERVDLPRYFVP